MADGKTVELLSRDPAALEQGVARRSDEKYLLDHQDLVVEMIVGLRRGHDREVEFAAEQAVAQSLPSGPRSIRAAPAETVSRNSWANGA